MADGYEIVRHNVGGTTILVLAREGRADFLQAMRDDGKKTDRYRLIVRCAARVGREGSQAYVGTLIRRLEADISLVELRVPGKVIRVMAYEHAFKENGGLVLLFDFDGHQGSSKIPKDTMEKAKRLAVIARKTMAEG